jgi:hypothetical protein
MIIFCSTCRSRLDRVGNAWRHHDGEPADSHVARPLAARRSRLFDPDVVGLPGYDVALARLVEQERAAGVPMETWRVGLYVFDGRVRGVFRYAAELGKIPAGSVFQPPAKPSRALLRNHPIVKARLVTRPPAP